MIEVRERAHATSHLKPNATLPRRKLFMTQHDGPPLPQRLANSLGLLRGPGIGARIRNRCRLVAFEARAADQFMIRTLNEVELEGSERPAMVAEWLGVFVRKPLP